MNAKDKAKKLVKDMDREIGLVDNTEAKQCALICVDEIIKVMTPLSTDYGSGENWGYWEQVKEEIKRL